MVVDPPDEMERLLRAARPEPRREFVEVLERRLLPRRQRRRLPRAFAVAATAAALAMVGAILSVLGTLPGRLGGDRPANAKDDCKTVMVERIVRRPHFVVGRDGALRLAYRPERVRRPVQRCR
jgi:hypothetical protein